MYAAYHNHVSVANVLIEQNCNIDSTDNVIIRNLFLLFQTNKRLNLKSRLNLKNSLVVSMCLSCKSCK